MPSCLALSQLVRAVDAGDRGISPFPGSPCWRLVDGERQGKAPCGSVLGCAGGTRLFGSGWSREKRRGKERKMNPFFPPFLLPSLPSFSQLEPGEEPSQPQLVAMGGWHTGVGMAAVREAFPGCQAVRASRGSQTCSAPSSSGRGGLPGLVVGCLHAGQRGAGEEGSCGSASRCFFPACGCACSQVSTLLDLSTSRSDSKSLTNRSVQGYCGLPAAALLSA